MGEMGVVKFEFIDVALLEIYGSRVITLKQ